MHFVIEGQDATGKDTQATLLANYFRRRGKRVVHYAESGTGSTDPFVVGVAELNFGRDYGIDHLTHSLLYLTNRYRQWRQLAEPALKNGDIVITSRNWLSTLIYEGYAGGADKDVITELHRLVLPHRYFRPDGIVILTLSDEDRARRLVSQGNRHTEVFKSMNTHFHKTLNRAYLKVAEDFRIPTLNAAPDPETVHKSILSLFSLS